MRAYQAQIGVAKRGRLFPEGSNVYVEPDAETTARVWKINGFTPVRSVIVDPPKLTGELKDLKPNNNIVLLFTEKPSKEWKTWIKTYKVEFAAKTILTSVKMKGLLMQGSPLLGGFKLTEDAAELIVETFGDSTASGFFSICFTLDNARDQNKTLLTLDDVVDLWPDPGFKLARDISHDLGRIDALHRLMDLKRHNSDSIFGLWRYLEIVVPSKHPHWYHLLHAFRSACDRKYYDYYEGLFLFIHSCYKAQKKSISNIPFRTGLPSFHEAI